jgi:hypothetical protein
VTTVVDRYAAELSAAIASLSPARHAITLTFTGNDIAMSCTCRARRGFGDLESFEPIECRRVFPAADVKAAWRAWHEQRMIAV